MARIVTVKLPVYYIEAIDELVRRGKYISRSEVIRVALRELLKRELWSSEEGAREKRRDSRVKVVELG